MDASDLVDKYRNVSVSADVPNAPFSAAVSINKYLIAVQDNIGTIRSNIEGVASRARRQGADVDGGMITRLKNGKASPDDMSDFLSLGVEVGALPADEAKLQYWADHNLGVDCTGFVIAYLVAIEVLEWNSTLNGGASCPWIYSNIAKHNWTMFRYAGQPEIWDMSAIQPDDIILWMKSGGSPETRRPGHIALVVDSGPDGLTCAESNGERAEDGITGPKLKTRRLNRVMSGGGKQWWNLDHGAIVVRPSGA
jgi:hypothetical protein